MAEINIDTDQIKDNAIILDKEVKKYNDALENIYQIISNLTNPESGCMSGADADAYVSSVSSTNEKDQYLLMGEKLNDLVKKFDDMDNDLLSCVNNNKFQ